MRDRTQSVPWAIYIRFSTELLLPDCVSWHAFCSPHYTLQKNISWISLLSHLYTHAKIFLSKAMCNSTFVAEILVLLIKIRGPANTSTTSLVWGSTIVMKKLILQWYCYAIFSTHEILEIYIAFDILAACASSEQNFICVAFHTHDR